MSVRVVRSAAPHRSLCECDVAMTSPSRPTANEKSPPRSGRSDTARPLRRVAQAGARGRPGVGPGNRRMIHEWPDARSRECSSPRPRWSRRLDQVRDAAPFVHSARRWPTSLDSGVREPRDRPRVLERGVRGARVAGLLRRRVCAQPRQRPVATAVDRRTKQLEPAGYEVLLHEPRTARPVARVRIGPDHRSVATRSAIRH